jgi:hypothetical protein
VFDDSSCAQPLAFPRLSSTAPLGGFSTETLTRIEHFVLNDNNAAAPSCVLPALPPGAKSFPQITPLSHTPGGTP